MDQSPRFSTHVIRGLTDKFNHHRVKVYHLHVFWDSRSVFCAPHILARVQRERERGAIQIMPQWMDTYTKLLKYPFLQVFW